MAFNIILDMANSFTSVIQNKFLASLIILVLGFIVAKIISMTARKYLKIVTNKTKSKADDLIIERIDKPVVFLLGLFILKLALIPLQLVNPIIDHIFGSLVVIVIIYVIVVIFDIIIDLWALSFARKTKSNLDDAVLPLIHRFSRIFLIVLGLMFVLDIWGIQIGPLLASLGIAGIAVAFALQSTLGNIFGGISIILDKSVKVGDRLQLDDGTTGTVLDVGLRSTKMQTFDNEVIIIPNGQMAESKIQNLVLPDPSARVVILFGVEYGSAVEKVKKTIIPILEKLDTLKDKEKEPQVQMLEMADFSLNFRAVFWVESYMDKFLAKVEATEQIYQALNKAKIGIPFPTRTVYMKN